MALMPSIGSGGAFVRYVYVTTCEHECIFYVYMTSRATLLVMPVCVCACVYVLVFVCLCIYIHHNAHATHTHTHAHTHIAAHANPHTACGCNEFRIDLWMRRLQQWIAVLVTRTHCNRIYYDSIPQASPLQDNRTAIILKPPSPDK